MAEALRRGAPAGQEQTGEVLNLPLEAVQSLQERTWQFGALFADAQDAREERVRLLLDLLICEAPLKQAAAALTLPWYASSQAAGPLEEAMHDADQSVRRAARWAHAALSAGQG